MDSCGEALLEENKRLQIENNNIPILQEQIEELKKQLTSAAGSSSRTNLIDVKRMKDLEVNVLSAAGSSCRVDVTLFTLSSQHENATLKRENARMKQLLVSAKESAAGSSLAGLETPRNGDEDDESSDPERNAKRLSSSEVFPSPLPIDACFWESLVASLTLTAIMHRVLRSSL